MNERYAIFECVEIRIDLEKLVLTEYSPLERQEPASAPSEGLVTRYTVLGIFACPRVCDWS